MSDCGIKESIELIHKTLCELKAEGVITDDTVTVEFRKPEGSGINSDITPLYFKELCFCVEIPTSPTAKDQP